MMRAGLLATVVFCTPAFAGSFTFVSIDVPGGAEPAATALSENGSLVGTYAGSQSANYGFSWVDGKVTSSGENTCLTGVNVFGLAVGQTCKGNNIGNGFTYRVSGGEQHRIAAPSGYTLRPIAISAKKVIVGSAATSGTAFAAAAFMEAGGTTTLLLPPGAITASATAINASGLVVGTYSRQGVASASAFTYFNGQYETIAPPENGSNVFPKFVRHDGDIAGDYYSFTKEGEVGFVLTEQGLRTIDYPGSSRNYVVGITGSGAVVGSYYSRQNSAPHGFVEYYGKYSSFDFPGATTTFVTSSNPQGSVAGFYLDASNGQHAFVGICAVDQAPCTQ